jgi:DNA-binding PadR family transcriptional regulator
MAEEMNIVNTTVSANITSTRMTASAMAPSKIVTIRHMILQTIAERNEEMYAKTIFQSLQQYGATKERILIELNKLTNSPSRPVKRVKSPLSKRFLYKITENGVNELKKFRNDAETRKEPMINEVPYDPYLWLLQNISEPKTLEELTDVRGDSKEVICAYLSNLYKMGVIEKFKQPETVEFSQRNRNGQIIKRTTTVQKTYYTLKNGQLRERISEIPDLPPPSKTVRIDVPIGNKLKEPVFTREMEAEYDKWRREMDSKPEFVNAVITRANKCGVYPKTMFRIAFHNLKKQGLTFDEKEGEFKVNNTSHKQYKV